MDEVEADVEQCEDDSSSYGELEEHDVDCLSEDDFEQDTLDMFPAEIEDLGKRKGTNDARDSIVKKLRETPPNADASMGGYREVPVTKMPSLQRATYKTYKAVPDRRLLAKKECKDMMTKAVAVPFNHYVGMTLLASKNKDKLVNKFAKDASAMVDAYVEVLETEPTLEACPLEVNPVAAGSDSVSQTLYVPILFPKCSTPQWALVDTGA